MNPEGRSASTRRGRGTEGARAHTVAVLPVKRFGAAKQRLTSGISDGLRRALTEAMVTDVLIALRRTTAIDEVLVVTGEHAVAALAGSYDAAAVVDDPHDGGHSAAARLGVEVALARGAKRVLLVAGDCPAMDPAELEGLLAAETTGPAVIVVPDRHGSGTNALVLTPPDVMAPAFGPGSRERHEQRARDAGAEFETVEVPTLGLDIDTPDDLDALRRSLAQIRGGASHTRGLLARVARR